MGQGDSLAGMNTPVDTLNTMSTPDNSASSAGANVFNVVRRVRSFDDVVLQVQNAILEGIFQTGDRLPSERDLCQMFGVGRPTLREALRVLEVLGVVDIRPGKSGGIYVARQTGEGVGVTLASLIRMAGATPEELAEFRASFEGETAGWAARRALPEEVERLCDAAATVRSIAQDPSGRWSEVVAIDINFHQTVAHASRNRVRVAVMQGLLRAVERVELGITSLAEPRLLASTADDLEAVAAAIRDKDEDRARTAMRAHVEWFSELYVRAADGRSAKGRSFPL